MHTYVQRWRSDDSDTMGEIEMNQKDFCGARRYGIWAVNYVYVCGVNDNRKIIPLSSSNSLRRVHRYILAALEGT